MFLAESSFSSPEFFFSLLSLSSFISFFPYATFSEDFILKPKKGDKMGILKAEKRPFLNLKKVKMGGSSEIFILTATEECGLEWWG